MRKTRVLIFFRRTKKLKLKKSSNDAPSNLNYNVVNKPVVQQPVVALVAEVVILAA